MQIYFNKTIITFAFLKNQLQMHYRKYLGHKN